MFSKSQSSIGLLLLSLLILDSALGLCGPARDDSKCGSNTLENAGCPAGECCSEYGWCGSTSEYCNSKTQFPCGASTTKAPTTKAPTTAAPTTKAPTTKAPTTTAPTTTAPTTAAPTTLAPTTAAPTTKAPTTAAPTTLAPTTAAPTTKAPTTFAPTTCPLPRSDSKCGSNTAENAPCASGYCCSEYGWCGTTTAYCNSKSQFPCGTQAPTTAAPTTKPPTTKAPTTAAPTTLAPTTLAPTTAAPTTKAPTTAAPTTKAPTTVAPTTAAPTTKAPTTAAPTTKAPTTKAPTTSKYFAIDSCGPKMIALTYDDGPNFATTSMQAALKSEGIVATVFVNGKNWQDLTDTEKCNALKGLVANGHEVQSHSYTHPDFLTLSNTQVLSELQQNKDWIVGCGIPAPKFFRPPFGNYNQKLAELVKDEYVVAFWNGRTDDTEIANPTAQDLINVLKGSLPDPSTGAGAVILSHDAASYGFYQAYIDWLKATYLPYGYRFVTISECWNTCSNFRPGVSGTICTGPGGPDSGDYMPGWT